MSEVAGTMQGKISHKKRRRSRSSDESKANNNCHRALDEAEPRAVQKSNKYTIQKLLHKRSLSQLRYLSSSAQEKLVTAFTKGEKNGTTCMKKLLKKSEEDFKAKSTEEKLGKDWENMLVAKKGKKMEELIRLSTEVFGTTDKREERALPKIRDPRFLPKVRDPVRKEAEKWKAKLEDEKAKYKISLSALRGKEPFELKHLDLSNGEGHFGRLFAELKDLKKGVNLLTQDFKNRLAQVHSVSLKDKVKTNDVEKGGRRNLRTVGAILKEAEKFREYCQSHRKAGKALKTLARNFGLQNSQPEVLTSLWALVHIFNLQVNDEERLDAFYKRIAEERQIHQQFNNSRELINLLVFGEIDTSKELFIEKMIEVIFQ